MATLQKIRSKGPLLVIVIGLALFAFIAGDAWKVLQPHQGKQDVGEVNGEVLSAQDYQKMVDELSEVIKLTNGLNSLTEDQLNNVKDQVWQSYVNNKLIAEQAEKLGLKVTDAEIQSIIDQGTHPLLMQTPFRNPQTGMFDKDMLKKFLVDYANLNASQMPAQYVEYYQKMGAFWQFVEKTLAQSTLAEKYQNLVTKSLISNPVAAEDAFNSRTEQSDLLLAGVPYSSINDSTVQVSDSEIKDRYNEKKEQFKQLVETRDIRYIDVKVVPSDADRKAVEKEVTEYSNQLASTTADFGTFVRSTGSSVNYSDVPVSKSVFPADVASRLDSTNVNEVYGPYYNQTDDSFNAFKLLAKVSSPDSIQFRQIQVYADTEEKTKTLADSIYNALKGGADFAAVAKIYGQTGEATWVNAQSWEGSELDADNSKFINTLLNQPVNELANLNMGQANLILQVMNKKSMQTKYKVAVVKREVEFSKETYNAAYNKFSQFVAQNTTIDSMVKNAEESGYTLMPRTDLSSAEHYVGGVRSTREALKWIFAAKPGEVSPLYECGENDHLMVVALDKIHEAGYRDINSVAEMLRAEIRRDKKAEKIMEEMKKYNSIAQVKGMKDAVSDSVKHVTFSAPAYISVTRSSEPVIGAVAAKTAANKVSAPIKGNGGVYMIQVYAKEKGSEKFDAKQEETTLTNMAVRIAGNQLINDLYQKAKVADQRYLFF
ncbi:MULTISPECIES: peptidylprolyl isomerase [Phocaeicola]|jgi:peptidyl-prolyl cis-trans isomerase D|uniref:Peptidylprolyl isomerase n=2 Tax=Phocaeicola plebeius TaxID=310297 RepID=A0A412H8F0_9BACT|nr:peptidylprolyl isomerase [Phocaeicola plebeius]MBS4809370.1 SurA N-terminal domain-containing protein [Bacteroides sp.]RGR53982.1 peptidylprolyl isomerase [Phocaeicola plebeius]RGR90490.1 peptidylprolyl isomerase [Phocaeicola plebeius]RGS09212.1 peptidylprolyl isomerase [Phocaeicola plebeius]RHA32809.1 peptidylprolyl isomerase [Phocaeicola plebeius]